MHTLRTRGGRWATLGAATLADAALCTLVTLVAWVAVGTALGMAPVVVSSGSMSPLLRTGDVLLNGDPGTELLGPGTVVTFDAELAAQAAGPGVAGGEPARLVSHRIVAVGPDGYTTRGDANAANDRQLVSHEAVVGVGTLVVPFVGLPAVWLRQGTWALLVVLGLGAAAIASQSTLVGSRSRRPDHAGAEVTTSADLDEHDELTQHDDLTGRDRVAERDEDTELDALQTVAAATVAADGEARLWPEAPVEPVTSPGDGEPLWPDVDAAAVHAAARAADAALRAGRTLRTLDATGGPDEEPADAHVMSRAVARVTDLHDRTRGSGALTVLALVLVLGMSLGRAPSTAAAFVAASSAPDNRFATAELPDTAPLVVALPAVGGGTTVTSGNGNQNSTSTSATTISQATRVQGPATLVARVSNTQGGNVSRDLVVTVAIDGQVVATGAQRGLPSLASWTDVTVDLGTVDRLLPAGSVVTVTVELQRLQLQVGGPTVLTLGA